MESKIIRPSPKFEKHSTFKQRLKTRKIVSKMLMQASSYVVVMWNGNEKEEPVAVFDVADISKKDSLISKVFGKIAQHTAAVMAYCSDQMKMTNEQRKQSDRVAEFKAKRSAELAAEGERPHLQSEENP